jgi:hypothetical protein
VGDMSSLTQGRAGRRLATSRKPSEWLAGIWCEFLAGFECYLRISTVIYKDNIHICIYKYTYMWTDLSI